jgi:hypothetical protein
VNCTSRNSASHLITHLVVYIIARCSSLNTTTFCLIHVCPVLPHPTNCNWKGPSSNAARHLRKHAIFVGRFSATPSTIAQANSLQQGLHSMAMKHAESSHDQTVTVLRSAAQKQLFRNALARFVTACSISHKSVVSNEFKSLIMAVNPEAEHVLLRSSSSLSSRIVRNFRAQQEEVIRYLCDDTISCFHISTDT